MPFIIECDKCGYNRSSEQDGQMFHGACGICYQENCDTPTYLVELCHDCFLEEQDSPVIIDPGESLFT